MSEKQEWTFQIENNAGASFAAFSPDQKQEISCYKFDDSDQHPPLVRNKFCLFVESNDNRCQIWLTKPVLERLIAGLQLINE